MVFGILTVGFGFVSLFTGSSVMGWLGIVGLPSVVARLALSTVAVAWGVRFALRVKEDEPVPRTPQGTVILPPEKFSRKAMIGACWAPLFVIAALLYWMVAEVKTVSAGVEGMPAPSTQWWQILLSVTLLPLGLMAPFGTTILGWIAVGDIRRACGRISGLPLAVFDGLFFPLLALDGFLIWAWATIVNALHEQDVWNAFHAGEVSVLTKLGAASLCVLVDLWIIRRVWRAVRLDGGAPVEPWWSSKKGAITIGVACALIISAVGQRREKKHGVSNNPPQPALCDVRTSRLVAKLTPDLETGMTLDELPPVIIRTFPVAGTREVESGITEIRVTFNKQMIEGSWSWVAAWDDSVPAMLDQPRFDTDHRTCVIKVKLEAGRTYAWWLNSEQFHNFKDKGGRASVPYLLIFQTKRN